MPFLIDPSILASCTLIPCKFSNNNSYSKNRTKHTRKLDPNCSKNRGLKASLNTKNVAKEKQIKR